jgi:alpha-glucoside transport system substrate-binding protein
MKRIQLRGLGLGLALTCVVAACASPAGAAGGGEPVVTVLGSWTGDEQAGFEAMLRGFEKKYGIQVDYTGTRDADAVLTSDLKDGNPPDLAVLATPGELRAYAEAGTLVPIGSALKPAAMARQYDPGWRALMQAAGPDGGQRYYAIIVKAALKSVIWYDPRQFPARELSALRSPALTWAQLTQLAASLKGGAAAPWCLGLEDSSNSGWPGTDWIEDLLLHQSGPQVYDAWASGALPWTSAPVRSAWQEFGRVAGAPGLVSGGTRAELLTNYGQAGQSLFGSPAGCYLDHEGSFITGFYTQDRLSSGARPQPGRDFNFISFPALAPAGQSSEEVAGDLLGMFRGSAAARQLIGYLTTPAAQEAWIRRPGSGAISANRLVPLSAYPDPVSRALAANLTRVTSVRFDASDLMSPAMESAFNNAVLEYLDSPGQLSQILQSLDQVRKPAY